MRLMAGESFIVPPYTVVGYDVLDVLDVLYMV
jgi:hypothetical protein